jgi:hypothetical protein
MAVQCNAEYHIQDLYAECHYAECHNAECRGASFIDLLGEITVNMKDTVSNQECLKYDVCCPHNNNKNKTRNIVNTPLYFE